MNQSISVNAKQNLRHKVTRRGGGLLLNKRELADALGEEERTIVSWVKAGILPVICCGYRTQRFKLGDVLDALSRREVKAVGDRKAGK